MICYNCPERKQEELPTDFKHYKSFSSAEHITKVPESLNDRSENNEIAIFLTEFISSFNELSNYKQSVIQNKYPRLFTFDLKDITGDLTTAQIAELDKRGRIEAMIGIRLEYIFDQNSGYKRNIYLGYDFPENFGSRRLLY